jgi:hypothetical protein
LERVAWDLDPNKGRSDGIISSIDRYVEISVDPHFQTFQVTFPYLVYDPDQVEGVYKYTLVTQRHPTANPPRYWIYPLLLILQSAIYRQDVFCEVDNQQSTFKSELIDRLNLLGKSLSISHYSQPYNTLNSSNNRKIPRHIQNPPSKSINIFPLPYPQRFLPTSSNNHFITPRSSLGYPKGLGSFTCHS